MKKYYLTGTDEEILLGDVIEVDFEKEFSEGRKVKRTEEFKVTEDSIPYLLDMGILQWDDEEEDDEEVLEFNEESFEEFREAVAGDIEELNMRLSNLENRIEKLEGKQNKPKKEAKK